MMYVKQVSRLVAVLFICILSVLSAGAVTYYPEGVALSSTNDSIILSDIETGEDSVLAFDYWYNPNARFGTGEPYDIELQNLIVHADETGSELPFGDARTFHLSQKWNTAVFDILVPGSDIELAVSGGTAVQAEGNPGVHRGLTANNSSNNCLYDKLKVKNIRSYACYNDYVSDNVNGNGNNSSHQPVPEPATMILFGTSLLGLIGMRFKRRNTQQ